jgi:hydroxyethylthiazole kinase-like uncharacterized protein yjeF
MPSPILTVEEMRQWEQRSWAAGISESAVIENVGRKIAGRLRAIFPRDFRILFLAGRGHNGDDARAAHRSFAGEATLCLDLSDPSTAATEFSRALASADRPELIVDGLFGIGVNRPMSDAWPVFFETLKQSRIPVISLDVPSGMNADTGEPWGACVQATETWTVGGVKSGLLAPSAWERAGRIVALPEVGLCGAQSGSGGWWSLQEDFADWQMPRALESNKGNFGHALIIAGSTGYHGAAVLATRAALRARPGLVTLFTPANVFVPCAAQLQAAMVSPLQLPLNPPPKTTSILVGPGLAGPDADDSLRAAVQKLWRESSLPMIADASALDWIPEGPVSGPRVITPHPGEAGRLLGTDVGKIQANRANAARRLSERCGGAWVILKGHQTLIGKSDETPIYNSSGTPWLAQGGSGDLLAGYIAGLLAQPGRCQDFGKTLAWAAWQHGAAAEWLTARRLNWTVDDLAEELGNAPWHKIPPLLAGNFPSFDANRLLSNRYHAQV